MRLFQTDTAIRKVAVGVGLVSVLGLVAFGARQVTATIVSSGESPPITESAPDTESTTTTTATSTTVSTGEQTGSSTEDTSLPGDPTGDGEAEVIIGEPTIIPIDFEPVPDKISIDSGFVVDLDVFVASQVQSSEVVESGEADTDPGSLTFADPLIVDPQLAPPERGFGAGIWADPDQGHHATINVGVNTGPNALSQLIVDFGDGTTLALDDRELSDLTDGGVVEIVHRYEPTLTPQRQTASVMARDTSGEAREWTTSFTTRAQFLAGFSPLTVTALGDCDFFGKGDFVLSWNIDGRDMSSAFKLGEGDTFVEQDFRIGIDGLFYDEPRPLGVSIAENDSITVEILKFIADFPIHEFDGAPGRILPDVIQFGTHVIPYSIIDDTGDCEVRLDFAVTYALSERAGA